MSHILYRFMSNQEFSKLTAGCPIYHKTGTCKHSRTTSNGICFQYDISDNFARESLDWLIGIVSSDVLVKFSISDDNFTKFFIKSSGTYAYDDPEGIIPYIARPECYTSMYDSELCVPIAYNVGDKVWYTL